MGCSLSSQGPPAASAAEASVGAKVAGEGDASLCSGWRISAKKWRKKRRGAEERRKGGVFDRRGAGPGRGEVGEAELHRVPGRMILNGASEMACLFTQQGKKGTNQDAMIVWEDFASTTDAIFCGVFDGHGPLGHLVARKVRDSLPLKLCNQWKAIAKGQESPQKNDSPCKSINSEDLTIVNLDDEWSDTLNFTEDEKLPEIYIQLKKCFLKSFKLMDKELKLLPTTDCFCSGSTAVTLVKLGQDLIIGNLGDSRAILGTRDKDNNLVALQLTVDLKPNLPKEAARIEQCKGRVFALQDEPEVARVWLPNSNSPGLAMARAFGDFCLKDYGLISVPDMSYRRLTVDDEFVVLATDGIWDVLSNKEVVDIVDSAPTRATAARAIVDSATRAWRLKFPTSKIDDCAAICLFLCPPPAANGSTKTTACTSSSKEEAEHEAIQGSFNHSSDEIVPACEDTKAGQSPVARGSARSLADCISTKEEEEWSALDGVTRVNSLLNLPRFMSNEKRSNSRRK